ncbi:MAG: acyltransferase family protein [Clostridia bacterium]|nr:acyltransferase family protein [Clostridia bacterium]
MFFPESYLSTDLNGVTWTLTVFALFYIIFPRIVKPWLQHPLLISLFMFGIQYCYTFGTLKSYGSEGFREMFNQFPAFLGVIAIGMGCAFIYAKLIRKSFFGYKTVRIFFTLMIPVAVYLLTLALKKQAVSEKINYTQLLNRIPIACLFALLLITMLFGVRLPFRKITAFLAGISFNVYLWHQQIAVWLKYRLRIPGWEGNDPPNILGDEMWMKKYNLTAWVSAIAIAITVTYLFEKPITKILKKKLE